MRTEYDFIINPKARSGMGEMVWHMLEPELKKQRVIHHVHLTARRKHAEEIAAAITADRQEHTIIVLGGDGTVNEVVNGIRDPGKVTLGYIPIGSSNDFARGLGIPRDPASALRAVLNPRKIVNMDIGVLTRESRQETRRQETRQQGAGQREMGQRGMGQREMGAEPGKSRHSRRFAVSAGMGFDAAVCHEVCVSRWKVILNKLGLGKLSYAVVALDRLVKDRPVRMTLTLPDGSRRVFEKTYFAAFMNLRYEGGGFQFCPQASPDDGMLDVIVAHGLSRIKILFLLPTAFAGKHVRFRGITIQRCRRCSAEAERPLALHTDGEPGFPRRRVEVSVMEEKLRVIAG